MAARTFPSWVVEPPTCEACGREHTVGAVMAGGAEPLAGGPSEVSALTCGWGHWCPACGPAPSQMGVEGRPAWLRVGVDQRGTLDLWVADGVVHYCYPEADALASRPDGCPACGYGAKGRPATLYAYGPKGIASQVGPTCSSEAVLKLARALQLDLADVLVVAAIISANRGRSRLDSGRTQRELDRLRGVP